MTSRLCPVDGKPLIEVKLHGEIIDQCPVCRGIWCDKGELERMVDRAARPLAMMWQKNGARKPFVLRNPKMQARGENRFCPLDGAELIHRERHGVAIDLCPFCHGIWLDADELQAIICLTAECLIQNHKDDDFATVDLPLCREPERQVSRAAAQVRRTLAYKGYSTIDKPNTHQILENILDVTETSTDVISEVLGNLFGDF